MRYVELKESLKDFSVFSLPDIRCLDSGFHRRRLNEWQDKGYLAKVARGYYVFADTELNEPVLFEIANRIYSPSYVSCEMALSHYGLIPESVYAITSTSTRRTYTIRTQIAEFQYRTVKPPLFFGYDVSEHNGKHFKIATPEKALLDFFYLHPELKNEEDFASLRINADVLLSRMDHERFRAFLARFEQKTLERRMDAFFGFLENA